MPQQQVATTFRRAPRAAQATGIEQDVLFGAPPGETPGVPAEDALEEDEDALDAEEA